MTEQECCFQECWCNAWKRKTGRLKHLNQKENKELLVKKCMSLTIKCISVHIFIAVDCQEPIVVQKHKTQTDEMQEI